MTDKTIKLDDLDLEILELITRGYDDYYSASIINIRPTVIKHRVKIMLEKLDFENRIQLVVWFVKKKIRATCPRCGKPLREDNNEITI